MCPFTKRLRDNAVCIDMHSAADVIDAMDKCKKGDEALMKRALRALEVYEAQTRPIWEAQEVAAALRGRLPSTDERAAEIGSTRPQAVGLCCPGCGSFDCNGECSGDGSLGG